MTESELREIWDTEYCRNRITTFDGVKVACYVEMFDHIFFESDDRKIKDKSILSYNRLEKIYWIKDTLEDPEAILKKGWDREQKKYFKDRRVAIVKGNYVVIIRFTKKLTAKLVTAYEKEDISNIMSAPNFEKTEDYF
ncbi:hypothetical protein [Epilithonimonas tenax]|uniref:hypothetical protein n=1 Tax=Epilithonimonas tenax TaxID=191577 RepID=UPI0012B52F7A|nr:hypothetical protein [Epilithonimonas tenax]